MEIDAPLPQSIIKENNAPATTKTGRVFLEALLADHVTRFAFQQLSDALERDLSSLMLDGLVGEISVDLWPILADLEPFKTQWKTHLLSIIPVDYVGAAMTGKDGDEDNSSFFLKSVDIKISVYRMNNNTTPDVDEALLAAANYSMPHSLFAGEWDELIFDQDLKSRVLQMTTNMLRFSSMHKELKKRRLNPMILLHGLPGTGKSTLCRALVQKISIRLNNYYPRTTLVQIKTSMFFSKWFSESAKQVDCLFTAIEQMCQKDRKHLICVLIDEVESIAGSRLSGSTNGGSQDNLRATNAFLTGFDKLKFQPNIIVLATTNMIDHLDSAFVDRCGLKLEISPPSAIVTQYKILRRCFLGLIKSNIIKADGVEMFDWTAVIPSYTEASTYETLVTLDDPGTRLLRIVRRLNSNSAGQECRIVVSGRFLSQLPELGIMQYMENDSCSLAMALDYVERIANAQSDDKVKAKHESPLGASSHSTNERL